jgi:hypothetical protein
MLNHNRVWHSHCFMLLASRKYSILLCNSLLSSISSSYLAAVSLHSHEARTGHVTRSRIHPPPPRSETQPSRQKPMHSKDKWVSQPARQSISRTKQDRLIIRKWARRLAILTTDLRYCNLNKIHHGRFFPRSLQFRFRSRPNIRWIARLINVFGKASLNSQRISH